MSTPAVVFSLGFTYDWAIGGYDFLEYMDLSLIHISEPTRP